MSNEKASAASQSGSRTITHKHRSKSDDVNPLLRSATHEIVSADDNFIVGRQKKGQLHNIVPGFSLSFRDKMFNGLEKYYEVDKRNYPFSITFREAPSAQATFKFDVTVEFSLKVIDPCVIVRENHTSLLDCILQDMKSTVHSVTSRFMVQKAAEASLLLQTAIASFDCPPYLKMTAGVVDISADAAASKMLRELEQKDLEMALISKKGEIETGIVLTDRLVQLAQNIEDHELQKQLPKEKIIGMVSGESHDSTN